jgi:hypothetical protein
VGRARDFEAASAAYRRALLFEPQLVPALVNLANVHYERDELVEAEALYEKAVRIDPECFEAHFNLGNIHHDLARCVEAARGYCDALVINPGYPEAHFYLAVTLEKLVDHRRPGRTGGPIASSPPTASSRNWPGSSRTELQSLPQRPRRHLIRLGNLPWPTSREHLIVPAARCNGSSPLTCEAFDTCDSGHRSREKTMAWTRIASRIGGAYALSMFAAVGFWPAAAQAQPAAASGYVLEQNCPNLTAAYITSLGVAPSLNLGHMALDGDGDELYIVYTPGAAGAGTVHVRDLGQCRQRVLIAAIDGPLGIAVHPYNGNLYITHRYLNPDYVAGVDPLSKKFRSAISVYNRSGDLVVDKWVKGFAPSICCGPATENYGNGAQGLVFDPAGNLYLTMNVDVHETASYDGFYASGALYQIDPAGEVSVFATGLRASFDAVIAETNWRGEAVAFYAGDNGEGDWCAAAGAGCANRVVPGSAPSRAITRMYYDELNYVVRGGHYGYPESAPTAIVPFVAADHVTHNGPLWNFEKVPSTAFGFPGILNPVPTGIALIDGQWGRVRDPLFVTFWSGQRLDMFTGPNKSRRTTLVSNLLGRATDVVTHGNKVYFSEETTRLIYTVRPARPVR